MRRTILALVLACACGSGDNGGLPKIDQLAPPLAALGATVNILGINFCGGDDSCPASVGGFVTFGTASGIDRADPGVQSWTDTRIIVKVPASATVGASSISVTAAGRQSNLLDFEVLP